MAVVAQAPVAAVNANKKVVAKANKVLDFNFFMLLAFLKGTKSSQRAIESGSKSFGQSFALKYPEFLLPLTVKPYGFAAINGV